MHLYPFLKRHKAEIFIFSAAIILRGIFFIAYLFKFGESGLVYGDASLYLQIVDNLLRHEIFSISEKLPLLPDSYFSPGYPFFLLFFRIFTASLWPVGLTQIILGAVTALLVYRLGSLWSSRIGLIVAFLFALEPTMAFWAPVILTESLYTFLFILALYLLAAGLKRPRVRTYLFSAFILGLAALVRPGAQYIFYLFAIFSFVYFLLILKNIKKTWVYLLMFIFIFNATISPWLIRNYQIWGKAKLSSAGWYILATLSAQEYLKFWKYFPPAKAINIPALQPCGENEKINWNFDCENQYRDYVAAAWRANPSAAIAVHAVGAAVFFMGDGYMNIIRAFWPEIKPPEVLFGQRNLAALPSVPFMLTNIYALVFWLGKFFWAIVYGIMLYGIFSSLKDKERALWILLFLGIIASIAIPAGAIAYARYRFPVNPLIFLMFAVGVDIFLNRYQ